MNQKIQFIQARIDLVSKQITYDAITDEKLDDEIFDIEKDIDLLENSLLGDDEDINIIEGLRQQVSRLGIDYLNFEEELNEEPMSAEESLIWDSIISSAQTKIDYAAFESFFSEMAEDILLKIIIGFASGKSNSIISAEIFSNILLMGYHVNYDELKIIMEDKDKELGLEIYLAQLASSMLENGSNPISVYNSIQQLLKNNFD